MTGPIAIIVLGPGGMDCAARIAAGMRGAQVHGLRERVEGADFTFDNVADHLGALYRDGCAIIGVCAAGILIRALAGDLVDKTREPPVVAVAEDGGAVVPLLGGHHGANDLARDIGHTLDVSPAITTAGDVRFGIALDDPPPGWRLANPDDAKLFMAELLAGATVRLDGDAPWLADADLPWDDTTTLVLTVSEVRTEGSARNLVYHPATLALGIGCERGADPGEVLDLARETLAEAGLSENSIAAIVSLDLKADEPAVLAAAEAFGAPARFFDAAALEAQTPRLANPSDIVFAEVGCHGVAEGAALAAVGPDGALIVEKRKSKRATCAVARASAPLEVSAIGRARGWLGVIGTGPGTEAWLTPEAAAMVARADEVVGYGLYLDLLGARIDGKTRHDYALGEEETRVRAALDLAAKGRSVALVSSGDPGIYAMATLVFEQIDRGGRADWRRLDIEVAPGISALQAAAARIGAPLGHDFCTISLSDLMTPWDVIEDRITAAATGDFVIAFYNPVSRRRDWQLARAREILMAHRPEATPVVLARKLGRDGERVRVTTLRDLDVGDVDMLTVVLVGSSETRAVARGGGNAWVYTPRGYGARPDKDEKAEDAT